MSVRQKTAYLKVEEYLKNEEDSSVRHEFVDGQVYSMTGATGRHREITANTFSVLRTHLKGSNCRVDMCDAQVHVAATNSYYYPDVVVSCGEFDDESMEVAEPVLLVEVLSRSTSSIDRREKLFAYRKIETLREYLIVYQRNKRIELHRRNEDGHWDLIEIKEGDVELESMPCGNLSFSLDLIYEGLKWPRDDEWRVPEQGSEYLLEDVDF